MGKKRNEDEGLKFLKLMNARRFRTPRNIFSDMVTRFGKNEAEEYLDPVEELQCRDHIAMYEVKNSNYEKCLMYTLGMDADILRKAINWIYKHKDKFGKKILDVGCDCGIMSCFLAMTFSDSQIMSIDRGKNGPELGKKLADYMKLNNITFIGETDILSYDGKEFDTIFSMRTVHENSDLAEYAKAISKKIALGGNVISIEKMEIAEYSDWVKHLEANGLLQIEGTQEALKCDEVDEVVYLTASVIES